MDPISGLSVASSIITFVEFAAKLISTSKVIFSSKEGASAENLELENIYGKLQALYQELSSPPDRSSEDTSALHEVSMTCKKDCEEIINIVRAQKVEGKKHRPWRSVRAAFKAQIGRKKIDAIENRLERAQGVVSLHISSILGHQVSHLSKIIDSAAKSMGYSPIIESMSEDLENLKLESNLASMAKTQPIYSVDQIQPLLDRLSTLAGGEDNLRAKVVLDSLNYSARPLRHNSIPDAHRRTYEWAFSSPLSVWLRSGIGIFWVSGKAGSGKSTIMKFLADHPKTRDALEDWADSKHLVIAAHYFWNAGTRMQKSQQGLLQSLLFDIFVGHPASIHVVCPQRYAGALSVFGAHAQPWTTSELSSVLHALGARKDLPLKYCFFIDGLDEYEDDRIELCSILQDLSRSPNIKICLSSRPWVEFEDSFGTNPVKKLYMHDLTQDDIRGFVNDQLVAHPKWADNLTGICENEKRDLICEVTERAEGVFLWAFLVVRSLREGLSNDDTIIDIQKRLRSLPKDLELLFQHMLEGVEDVYHSKMAAILLVALHGHGRLHIDIYWYIERDQEEMDYAIVCSPSPVSGYTHRRQMYLTRRRINARTRGLLETRHDGHVEFVHRTVRDFLSTEDSTRYLRCKLSPDYNPYYSIAKANLAIIKRRPIGPAADEDILRESPGSSTGRLEVLLHVGLNFATKIVGTFTPISDDTMEQLLDEYEMSFIKAFDWSHITIRGKLGPCDPRVLFREKIVRFAVVSYLRRKLQAEPGYFSVFPYSPLYAMTGFCHELSWPTQHQMLEIFEVVVRDWGDINLVSEKAIRHGFRSPWASFLRCCCDHIISRPEILGNCIMRLLFSRGASPDAICEPPTELRTTSTLFSLLLRSLLSIQGNDFESYIRALDTYLETGPNLGVIPLKSDGFHLRDPAGGIAWRQSGPQNESTLTQISRVIREQKVPPSTDRKRVNYFYRVLEKIVRYALTKNENLTILASAIREAVPVDRIHHVSHLLDLIERGNYKYASLKRRRDLDGGEVDGMVSIREASASHKRQKALPLAGSSSSSAELG
ncbi:hypothetical protein F5Y04DRAFT_290297 [Hypomontagnella monticulosa]|nr:hypothetical protein F5Y04DRAFT_290297 [Hypomontagnella monticulosa]